MRRSIAFVIAVLLSAAMLLPVTKSVTSRAETLSAAEGKFYRSENPVPNQYLVIFRDDLEAEEQSITAGEFAYQYAGQVLQCPYAPGVNGFSIQMSEANALALSDDARVQYVQEIPASGFQHSGSGTNVALAANGAQAFASSTLNNNFPASAIINGDRRGAGWAAGTGGWHDATVNNFPDYLEIQFNGEKRINEIDLFTLQDNFNNPAEPTEEMTFSQYGVSSFRLSYWDSPTGQWIMLAQVDGNNKVWRTAKFPTVVTPKLSIAILNGSTNYSRVVEIEAWEAPASTNVALASNGGQAFASSTLSSAFPVSSIIDGDGTGTGWGAGTGGWHDATSNSFPDYLEIHFNGEKRINEVDLITLQDNFLEPVEPTPTLTFSQYGVTAFRVSYWNNATAQWVMLTEVTDNNLVARKLQFPTIKTQKLSIMVLNGIANHSRVVEVEAWEAPPSINVALSANGGQAYASSTLNANFPVSAVINGDRNGSGWGAGTGDWSDATSNAFPDNLELHFDGEKIVHEVDFFTLQDSVKYPVAPSLSTTFSLYGVTAFNVSYWNSATSQWVLLKEIQGNNNVWRKVEFDPVQTSKLSINILNSANNYSRVVEAEVWGTSLPAASGGEGPVSEEPFTGPEEPDPTFEEGIVLPGQGPVGDVTNAAAATPTPTPVAYLKLSTDKKYFVFDNKTMALVGNSSSYVPHIARNRPKNNRYDPVFENCTFDEVGGFLPDGVTKKRKFHVCVDQIVTSGLNHMQIWVALNHSLGMLRKEGPDPINNVTGAPYADEQPFKRSSGKWDLKLVTTEPNLMAAFNNQFFNNLKEVVSYCQDKRVVLGIVLFDPWSGWTENPDVPSLSPWWPSNNNLVNSTTGKGFLDPKHFAKSDSFNINTLGDATKVIDSNTDNKLMRSIQVALLKRTVLALKDYRNFYWVLSNEPDFGGAAVGQPLITWLRYMANTLRANEPAANRHLIAVNVTTNPATIGGHPPDSTSPTNPSTTKVITAMTQAANVDIITSHYVQLPGAVGPTGGKVQATDRYGAIRLVRDFNKYTSGAPNIDNTKLWGFSEDRPTGVRNWNPPFSLPSVFTPYDPTWAAAAVRVEAWEFLMNGGGLFDHLSYRWGNLTNVNPPFAWNKGNEPQAIAARNQLGYLNKFLGTLTLDGMKRMMTGETASWINPAPTYGPSSYWAAMSRPRTGSGAATKFETFLFYFHRSGAGPGVKYEPYNVNENTTTVTVTATQMPNVGCYQAEWYAPSGETIDNKPGLTGNGTLAVLQSFKFYSSGPTTTRPLTSPKYKQDVLLKISWFQAGQCPPQ
jgi:hypothetical protein